MAIYLPNPEYPNNSFLPEKPLSYFITEKEPSLFLEFISGKNILDMEKALQILKNYLEKQNMIE